MTRPGRTLRAAPGQTVPQSGSSQKHYLACVANFNKLTARSSTAHINEYDRFKYRHSASTPSEQFTARGTSRER
jgi:hypothetical protein